MYYKNVYLPFAYLYLLPSFPTLSLLFAVFPNPSVIPLGAKPPPNLSAWSLLNCDASIIEHKVTFGENDA